MGFEATMLPAGYKHEEQGSQENTDDSYDDDEDEENDDEDKENDDLSPPSNGLSYGGYESGYSKNQKLKSAPLPQGYFKWRY